MDVKKHLVKLALTLAMVLAGSTAHATCRALVEGEPNFAQFSKCCDAEGENSIWTNRFGGKESEYSGSCEKWGIGAVPPGQSEPTDNVMSHTGSGSTQCIRNLQGHLDNYNQRKKQVIRMVRILDKLHHIQPVAMPKIELCIVDDVAEIKAAGAARELSEWSTYINSILAIAGDNTVNAVTWLGNEKITQIASRQDIKLPLDEALVFYREYMSFRSGSATKQVIRSQSCMQYKLKSSIHDAQNLFTVERDRILTEYNRSACSAADRDRLDVGQLKVGYWKIITLAQTAMGATPSYSPDYTGCF